MGNMHEANADDVYFLMPKVVNDILPPHLQLSGK